MKTARWLVLIAGVMVLPVNVGAQQVAPRTPPAACLKDAKDFLSSQVIAFRAANAKLPNLTQAEINEKDLADSRTNMRAAEKMAATCAATFNLETIPANQLIDLIPLLDYARDTVKSALAFQRMMTAKLAPRERGRALLFGMAMEVNRQPTRYGMMVDSAESYVAQIDRFPDSLADVKLTAHKSMLGRYDYLDAADGLRIHATALMALARQLNKPSDILFSYKELARSAADRLQPDSAFRFADAAEKELGAVAVEAFKDFRRRYALIGKPATAITAEWWINTDAKTVVAPAAGRVTLVEFTAHWCGPCKGSYPWLGTLLERFKGRPFDGVMVTQLYGYLGTERSLSPEQEVAADRVYFGKELPPGFVLAINRGMVQNPGDPYLQPKPDTDYRVAGIPQIVIIDKRGIIRQIITGWDQGNTARFGKLIEQLLSEPAN